MKRVLLMVMALMAVAAVVAAAVVYTASPVITVSESVLVTSNVQDLNLKPNESVSFDVDLTNDSSVPVTAQLTISEVLFNGGPAPAGSLTLAGASGLPFVLQPGGPTGFEVAVIASNGIQIGAYTTTISVVRPD